MITVLSERMGSFRARADILEGPFGLLCVEFHHPICGSVCIPKDSSDYDYVIEVCTEDDTVVDAFFDEEAEGADRAKAEAFLLDLCVMRRVP